MGPGQDPDDFELSGSGDLGMEGVMGRPGQGAAWMAGGCMDGRECGLSS